MPASEPFTHEIALPSPPDGAMRELVLRELPDFERLGYRIQSRTSDALVLRRRYVPRKAWAVPLVVAGFFALVCAFSGGMTLFALIAAFFLALAGLLALVVRFTERLTITVTAGGAGTRALVSGRATAAMRSRLLALGSRSSPANVPVR